jgi:hypothetical protein
MASHFLGFSSYFATTTNFHVPGAAALSDKLITEYILKAEEPPPM